MTTKNQIIYDILNTIRGGAISNTEKISKELLSFQIDNIRAKLIRQDQNKKRSINPDLIQILCVDLELVDKTSCPCEITDCTILRSILPIPECIELEHRNLLISVGPTDLTKSRFSLLPYHRAKYYNPNKFSKNITGCFIYNQYLYIISPNMLSQLIEKCVAEVIIERPEEARAFVCDRRECYSDDDRYPVSAAMIDDIKNIIIQNSLKIQAVAPSDNSNNSKHDLDKK